MKLVVYLETGAKGPIFEGITNPKLKGNELVFDMGSVSGIDNHHILLDDTVVPPDTWEEATLLNKMSSLTEVETLEQQNEALKQRISDLENALITIMDLM